MQTTQVAGCSSEELAGPRRAAILYAAGRTQAAVEELECSLRDTGKAPSAEWTMLFEILRAERDRGSFETLARRFQDAFPGSDAPRWEVAPFHAPGALVLEGDLVEASRVVETIKDHARERKVIAIDLGRCGRMAIEVGIALCNLIRLLRLQGRKVLLVNVQESGALLLAELNAGEPLDLVRRVAVQSRAPERRLLAAA